MSAPETARSDVPATMEVAGQPVVVHYGDVVGEYAALRMGALMIDRSARGRLRIEGPRAAEMLAGLVTNDVQALTPGRGQYAAALTPKGKIVADVRIFAETGSALVDAPPRAHAGWMAMARKYINPRFAPHRDVSSDLRDIGVFGREARRVTAVVSGADIEQLAALPPYGHLAAVAGDMPLTVARVPDLETEGYELFVPAEHFDALWQRLAAADATPGGLAAWEIARIEAGRPEWGLDIDETTIPQEANLDELHAISYTKGCYVGQEVVARVHFRGHVNRHLRGLLCGDGDPPPARAVLTDDAGKPVGEVRSSALSPRLGAIALAMVRREVEPGTTLTVRWEGGEARADVTRLPFPI